jgi:hypothetical protein
MFEYSILRQVEGGWWTRDLSIRRKAGCQWKPGRNLDPSPYSSKKKVVFFTQRKYVIAD